MSRRPRMPPPTFIIIQLIATLQPPAADGAAAAVATTVAAAVAAVRINEWMDGAIQLLLRGTSRHFLPSRARKHLQNIN